MVQIVIVGAGTVGYELAIQLQKQGHDVAIIEQKRERVLEIAEKLDILVVPGSGSSPSALEAAGIRDAEMILAVTSEDEVNILACGLAARYGVPQRIARVRNPELTAAEGKMVLDGFGVTRFINPERVIVQVIDQIARVPDALEVFGYHEGQILISRHIIKANMPVVDRNLMEILQLAGGRISSPWPCTETGKHVFPAERTCCKRATTSPRSSVEKAWKPISSCSTLDRAP